MAFNRLAKTISFAAITAAVAFVAKPAQQASAQGVPGQFGFPPSNPNDINTVVIDGAGASSISNPTLLQLWFDADANGSFASPTFSYDANGNSVIDANEEFNFWDGLGPAPIVDFNGDGFLDPANEAARFASYAITGSGNGRRAIAGAGRASLNDNFLFDFYGSDAIAVTSVELNNDGVDDGTDFPIYNVNPVDIQVVFPINVPGFSVRFTELTNAAGTGLCDFLSGSVANYIQLGGPNLPVTLVFRSDNSGTTSTFGNFIEPLCGFDGSGVIPEFEINGNVNPAFLAFVNANGVPTVGAPQSQGVVSTVIATPGAVTYVDGAFANEAGFGNPTGNNPFLAAVDDINVDLNGSGTVGDFQGELGFSSPTNPLGLGYTLAAGPVYFGFYPASVYATAAEAGTAANLCFFITSGLDFNGDGDAIDPFESGRQAAIDNGFAPPTQPGLDPNCGAVFPGFGGGQLVPQVFSPDGTRAVVPGPVLIGDGDAPIIPLTTAPQQFVPGGGTILDRTETRGFPLPQ